MVKCISSASRSPRPLALIVTRSGPYRTVAFSNGRSSSPPGTLWLPASFGNTASVNPTASKASSAPTPLSTEATQCTFDTNSVWSPAEQRLLFTSRTASSSSSSSSSTPEKSWPSSRALRLYVSINVVEQIGPQRM